VLVELGTVASTQHEAGVRYDGTPVLVTADRQTRGRGRLGRSWVHAARSVAASIAFETDWPPRNRGALALVAGLAACEAAGDPVCLKWPNDLMSGPGKVGGILVEGDGDLVVAGLGVNLWWPDPITGAVAMLGADPGPEAAVWLAEQWADRLLARVGRGPGDWGRDEYSSLCSTIGREITWEPAGAGTAVGIAADGGLRVAVADGETVLRSGEVHEVREAS
jgi:BirA family biotin operon repressor/biotin-[acetyl-CoA-carboxylase] ligase